MRTIPEDLLGLFLRIPINSKPILPIMRKVSIVINAEAVHAGALWHSAGVGTGQADGLDAVLHDVQVLEAGWSFGL